ncbi:MULTISPECIES: arginine decarboxylase [Hymenobacter]|uniref:Arginine decarboxylase n=2 Tax=Hymenobacter TaxID=89966 RepID=A0ABS6X3Y4_9BACT|nr:MULTISPECIES: arginine decarboxylase [Hymenobacter]MBO3270713.1 arginine decarboxylase [Hymenobacter defluvii]MBW3130533.1 arginine decarboxylase [Hymenobacter profundi]QNE40081.1 arginine decarboxylase [Hymenobacter sp. NBH84]
MDTYHDLISQTFDFPSQGFTVENDELQFHDIDLMALIEKHGTPLRLTYLPKISSQIQRAKEWFAQGIENIGYQGSYSYAYCTKASHFSFVVEEALKNNVHIETSSWFDTSIIRAMHAKGKLSKDTYIICNGFKRAEYRQEISALINEGFVNCVPILDHLGEFDFYHEHVREKCKIGIRVASDEEPRFQFYTSRLGVRYADVIPLYEQRIKEDPRFELTMLHYFINTGIKDTSYYWSELSRFVHKYCELRKVCPTLTTIDIGGGLPIQTSIQPEYDYPYMIQEVLRTIQRICREQGVPEPDIFTEFGIFTVGESGAILYSILDEKLQNDKELWYMIDGSFITNLPDTWALNQRFIMLAVNGWEKNYRRTQLGGLTCDSQDYYNAEKHIYQVFLPERKEADKKPLYVGFFHTGAYQESLSGYGGIKHCLIPAPKHIILDRAEDGTLTDRVFADEQKPETMMKILGYQE